MITREKSNFFKMFQSLCIQLQREQDKRIQRIRRDHG